MKRKRLAGTGLTVSLFPFLAVLVCTMGVLIVLLVLVVRSSEVHAASARREQAQQLADRRESLLDDLDLEEFRIREIEAMRPDLRQRLAEQRARRSHLEDEMRELRDHAAALANQWESLNDPQTVVESREKVADEIRSLEAELENEKIEMARLRGKAADEALLYSIIPTQAPGATARRPIYVECRPDGIWLRPSNIRLSPDDFTLPMLAGNPLDAALLANREHWKRLDAAGANGDPYPLLVVRPGGATAYAIARRGMTSWDDEFGYELVENDREIDWGEADHDLNRSINQAIADSRRRQQQLVALGTVEPLGNGSGREMKTEFTGNNDAGAGPIARDAATFDAANGEFGGSQRGVARARSNPGMNGQTGEERTSANTDDSRDESTQSGIAETAGDAMQSGTATVRPLAETRGADWALPTRTQGATAYRRPMRIHCTGSKYKLFHADSNRPPVDITIGRSTDESIDELIHEIWTQIEDWGMAEEGGFWKPVLRISANDNAGIHRAVELEGKLRGSGIEIERQWR